MRVVIIVTKNQIISNFDKLRQIWIVFLSFLTKSKCFRDHNWQWHAIGLHRGKRGFIDDISTLWFSCLEEFAANKYNGVRTRDTVGLGFIRDDFRYSVVGGLYSAMLEILIIIYANLYQRNNYLIY